MSGNVSTLGQLLDNNSRLKEIRIQLNTLQTQLSTQKKSTNLSGLGREGIRATRTRIELNQVDVFQSNIAIGSSQIKSTLSTLQEFMRQSKNISDALSGKLQEGNINLVTTKSAVQDTLKFLRDLSNTKSGDRYVLAGSDSYTKPMNDSGAHAAYMTGLVENWRTGTITTDAFISSYQSTPETTIGYSASLSSNLVKSVYVRADVNLDVDYTLVADSSGFKKILNALSLMENMNLDKVSIEEGDPITTRTAPGTTADDQKENFFTVYEGIIQEINSGIESLRLEEERLQRAQLSLDTAATNHASDKNLLETVLGNIEEVDPAEVAVSISSLKTQLESSYQVTGLLGSLSLTRYL